MKIFLTEWSSRYFLNKILSKEELFSFQSFFLCVNTVLYFFVWHFFLWPIYLWGSALIPGSQRHAFDKNNDFSMFSWLVVMFSVGVCSFFIFFGRRLFQLILKLKDIYIYISKINVLKIEKKTLFVNIIFFFISRIWCYLFINVDYWLHNLQIKLPKALMNMPSN